MPGLGLRLNTGPMHADRPRRTPRNWAAVPFGKYHPRDEESQHDEYSDDPPHSNNTTYRRHKARSTSNQADAHCIGRSSRLRSDLRPVASHSAAARN